MKALIRHTLRTNKGWIILCGICLIVGICTFSGFTVSAMMFYIASNVCLLLPGFSHQSDAGFNWNSFVLTLPVSKKQVIRAKYFISAVSFLIVVLSFFLSMFLNLNFSDTAVSKDEALTKTFLFFAFTSYAIVGNLFCLRSSKLAGLVGGLFGSSLYFAVNTYDRTFLNEVSEKGTAVVVIILVSVAMFFLSEKAAIKIYEKHGVK